MSPESTTTIVVTGAGGVGKTTIAASLGVVGAVGGSRSLVLTVDPARRLADALGIAAVHHDPIPVPGAAGLWAAMLDVTASWESLIHRYAEPDVADRLLVNPYFRAVADRFPAAQSFAAAETMSQLIESGHWDRIIVDTPPSEGGLDFFLSPAHMGELVGGKLLRWLTGARLPARRTLYRITARPMLRLADSVLGGPLLEDVAEFLMDLRTMYDGLAARSHTIERHLQATTTIVVTTSDSAPMRETLRFFEELAEIEIRPAAVLFNRSLPPSWVEVSGKPVHGVPDSAARALLKQNLVRWAGESRRQSDARRALGGRYGVDLITVPWATDPPTSVEGMRALLEQSVGFGSLAGGILPSG